MQKPSVNKHKLLLCSTDFAAFLVAGLSTLCLTTYSATPVNVRQANVQRSLIWEEVFSNPVETPFLSFTAQFMDRNGDQHTLRYWRDHSKRLRRNTDGKIDVMAQRLDNGEVRYHLLDHRRKIATHVDQSNLYRIGRFNNWNDLSSAMMKPQGQYTLAKIAKPDEMVAGQRCTWYRLTPSDEMAAQFICWAKSAGIPMKINHSDGNVKETATWAIQSLTTEKIADSAFIVDASNYAHIDANRDIDTRSD